MISRPIHFDAFSNQGEYWNAVYIFLILNKVFFYRSGSLIRNFIRKTITKQHCIHVDMYIRIVLSNMVLTDSFNASCQTPSNLVQNINFNINE